MTNLREWLASIGCGQYADAFEENEIDWDVVRDLDHEMLRDVGVSAVGARMRILKGIEAFDFDSVAAASPPAAGEAERRQLTVMFCDLVGSTSLSEGMDAEDYRELLGVYQAAVTETIEKHGGFIARYMGDGLLAYFGYPAAHEDDPARAVRTGLELVKAVGALDASVELEIRVGIATGPVVVGDIVGTGASQEVAVLGETPNLAARLQGAAAPNTVLLSAATYELLRGLVEAEKLEPTMRRGFSQPVQSYRAVRQRTLSEVSAGRQDNTPLIGRDVELALLERAWQRVQSGEGQAVLLSGEPGVGKSRLLRAFEASLAAHTPRQIRWYCSLYHQSTANYPAIEQLKRELGLEDLEASDALDALAAFIEGLGRDPSEMVPPLALLLSVPLRERYGAPIWIPEELKRRLVQAQVDLVLATARKQPVVLTAEDLHWADPTTVEVLEAIVAAISGAPVLVLATARPGFLAPWQEQVHATSYPVTSLSRHDTRTLIDSIAMGRGLSEDLARQLVERADGIPLYVEELTRDLIDTGEETAVPTSLQDSLTARLDRLGSAKLLAQTASVIGRSFSLTDLASLSNQDTQKVSEGVSQLINSGLIIHRRGQSVFEFKHALIRDVAYDSMLRSARRALHASYANSLATTTVSKRQPELLAQHYAAAGLYEKAIDCWEQASKRAGERSAHGEAVGHLSEAISYLGELSEDSTRFDRELAMQIALGRSLTIQQGYGSAEAGVAYERARELCQGVDNDEQRLLVLRGLWLFYLLRADLDKALELAGEIEQLSLLAADPDLLANAYHATGASFYVRGEFTRAYEHSQRGIESYRNQHSHSVKVRYGDNPGMMCGIYASLELWTLGYPDQAISSMKDAGRLAQELDRADDMTAWLTLAARLYSLLREPASMEEHATRAIALAAEHRFSFFLGYATILKGWAVSEQGHSQEGIALMNEGMELRRSTGTVLHQAYFDAVLAERYASAGQDEVGLSRFNDAFARLRSTGERWCEAELYRINGFILMRQPEPDVSRAEALLNRALMVSRRQQAKAWELRAATELARLLGTQGRPNDGYAVLAPVYESFDEGFDTTDMREARALLNRLSAGN